MESKLTSVVLHLLDSIAGRPIQSWKFDSKSSLFIGRGPDQDVLISDPYVSRLHAELRLVSGKWSLLAHGKNGVTVKDQQITEYPIDGSVVFRLGAKGPQLRFETVAVEVNEAMATQSFEQEEGFEFRLDKTSIEREVSHITEGDYFQSLLSKAKALRASGPSTD
jgi:pSer/pThr/pTyr-binding forkhead associated (FHA) protein